MLQRFGRQKIKQFISKEKERKETKKKNTTKTHTPTKGLEPLTV
jgi:hypothetical protein